MARLGVFGSTKDLLVAELPAVLASVPGGALISAALPATSIRFDERPSQSAQYPSVVVHSEGTDPSDYTFGGTYKVKRAKIGIEIYAVKLEDVEILLYAIEQVMDSQGALAYYATMLETDKDGISILDTGGETVGRTGAFSPDGGRTHRGDQHYVLEYRRQIKGN